MERSGIEWSNHYVPTPWLLLDLDISASRARFTDQDPVVERIPGAINRVASAGVTLNDLGRWSGSLQARYFGPRPLIEDNSIASKSTLLFNLRAAYKLDKNWKANFDVFNLFNRKASDVDYYYASRLRGEPAGGVNDIHFHPEEPRNFRLTLVGNF